MRAVVLTALAVVLVSTSQEIARATSIVSYAPVNGAVLQTSRPTFTIATTGSENSPGQSVFIRIAFSPETSGDGGLIHWIPYGNLLSIPGAGGSTPAYVDLSPGTYYWQWTYNDYGCFTQVRTEPPFDFYQPDCHPTLGTVCPLFASGRCIGPVLSFTIAQPPSDIERPFVRALTSSGRHARAVKLKYRVSDNRGETRERITVWRRGKLLKTIRTQLGPSFPGTTYYVTWRASSVPGRLRFCVRAWDRSGNASLLSCAPVNIR